MTKEEFIELTSDAEVLRASDQGGDFPPFLASELFTQDSKTICAADRLADVEQNMRDEKICVLVVQDDTSKVVGVVQIYD